MAAGDVLKGPYPASSNLTVTGLNSLASSATWVAGWESDLIDNSTAKYLDYRLTAKITVGAAPTAGHIRMYVVGMLDDTTWPDVFDGTGGAETVTSAEIRDAICLGPATTATTNTASRVYYLDMPSVAAVFGGHLPHKFVVFITHNTVQALAASGNQVTVKGSFEAVTQ